MQINTNHLSEGSFEQTVTVDTNLTESKSISLTLTGRIIDEVKTNLDYFEFDTRRKKWLIGSGFLTVDLKAHTCQGNPPSVSDFRGFENLTSQEQKKLSQKDQKLIIIKSLNGYFKPQLIKKDTNLYKLVPNLTNFLQNEFDMIQIWNSSCYSPLREIPIRLIYSPSLSTTTDYLDFGLLKTTKEKQLILEFSTEKLFSESLEVILELPRNYSDDETILIQKALTWRISYNSNQQGKGKLVLILRNQGLSKSSVNVSGKIKILNSKQTLDQISVPIYGILEKT
jgi:hypothetical protein